jgi:Tol biopolymer transport system component
VIDDFPEHTEEVGVARDRLASLERALVELDRQPTFRKIEIASKPQNGILSPDGNRLAFISDGSVWVVPLHGRVDPNIAGEPVRLAAVPGLWDNGSLFAWSANGEWIAVNSMGEDAAPVYLIPAAGGEPSLVELPDRGNHPWSRRLSLSPDGLAVAISALALREREEEPDVHERVIYSVPTAGGEPVRISSGWGRLPSFSPDGERIAYVGYRERDDWPDNPEPTADCAVPYGLLTASTLPLTTSPDPTTPVMRSGYSRFHLTCRAWENQ